MLVGISKPGDGVERLAMFMIGTVYVLFPSP